MARRATLRRRLAWAALVVLLCSMVTALRMRRWSESSARLPLACAAADRDSARLELVAVDTIAELRARRQGVRRFARTPDGVEIRTEDDDPLAAHDGGLAAFDCSGHLTFLWLDGG